MAQLLGDREESDENHLRARPDGSPDSAPRSPNQPVAPPEPPPNPPRPVGGLQLDNLPSMAELLNESPRATIRASVVPRRAPSPLRSTRSGLPRPSSKLAAKKHGRRRSSLPKQVIVDGSNVCRFAYDRGFAFGGEASSLVPLLGLCLFFVGNRISFRCLFDASERFALARNARHAESLAVFNDLLRHAPRHFAEVTAGRSADDAILELATRLNCAVVSNDRFNKSADAHMQNHPWLTVAGDRLIRAQVSEDGTVVWPALGVRVAIDCDPRDLADELLANLVE